MKKYVVPSVTGQDGTDFLAPELAVVGLSKTAAVSGGKRMPADVQQASNLMWTDEE